MLASNVDVSLRRAATDAGVVHLVSHRGPICDPRHTRVASVLVDTDAPASCPTCVFLERHQEQVRCSACGRFDTSTAAIPGRIVNDKQVRLCAPCRSHGGLR